MQERTAWKKTNKIVPKIVKRKLAKSTNLYYKITIKGNGSMKINMEKGGIIMNVTMMVLV